MRGDVGELRQLGVRALERAGGLALLGHVGERDDDRVRAPRARARPRAWRPTASACCRPAAAGRAARRPARARSPRSSAAAGRPPPAARRRRRRRTSRDRCGCRRARAPGPCRGSAPRSGSRRRSRPASSTISTPSSSDSTSERNASRSRSDARHVARQHELSAPMNAECTSAHSHGELGAVVVDDRGRDPLLDQHVRDGRAERHPVLVERQRRDHHEEVEVGLGQPVGDVDEQRRAREQADRDDQRLHPPAAELELREHREDADRRAVQRRLRRAPGRTAAR